MATPPFPFPSVETAEALTCVVCEKGVILLADTRDTSGAPCRICAPCMWAIGLPFDPRRDTIVLSRLN
jgi:hypothetical protein